MDKEGTWHNLTKIGLNMVTKEEIWTRYLRRCEPLSVLEGHREALAETHYLNVLKNEHVKLL